MPAVATPTDAPDLIGILGADSIIKQGGSAGRQGGVRLQVGGVTVGYAQPTREGLRLWLPVTELPASLKRGLEVQHLAKGSTIKIETEQQAAKVKPILDHVAKAKVAKKP